MNWRTRKFWGRPWQDWLFVTGEVVFLAMLAPLLFAKSAHVPFATGAGTSIMLLAFTVAHISYRNWLTVALSIVTATVWMLIGCGVHL